MSRKSTIFSVAWLAVGVLVVLAVQHILSAKYSISADVEGSTGQVVPSAQSPPSAPVAQRDFTNSGQVTANPQSSGPKYQANSPSEIVADKTARYAKEFRPGVFGDEEMLEFAQDHFFPTEGDKAVAIKEYERFQRSPATVWSTEVELKLQAFIAEQADMSGAHVSVTCRAAECKLQLVERKAVDGSPVLPNIRARTLGQRLIDAPWFLKQFMSIAHHGSTPEDAAVSYSVMTLVRRKINGAAQSPTR